MKEKKESLTADEMAIKRVSTYDKKADRVHELVGLGGLENELGLENQPTHLLVFVGLSTHYTRVLLLEVDNRRVA